MSFQWVRVDRDSYRFGPYTVRRDHNDLWQASGPEWSRVYRSRGDA